MAINLKLSYDKTPVVGNTKIRPLRGTSKTTPEDIECLMEAREQAKKYGDSIAVRILYRLQTGDYHAVCGPQPRSNILKFPTIRGPLE